MPLYTSSYLKQLSRNKSYPISQKLFSESKKTHTGFDIFLCHSFLDREEIEGIYIELTNQGFSVYVDWIIDPQLDRNNVTKATAELIRDRLKMSKSLLLAMSVHADLSRWIPWELGFVDGHTNLCTLFPVSKDPNPPNTFQRAEYLQLYPYIKRANINNYSTEIFITESSHTYVTFDNWIRQRNKPFYNLQNIDFL